MAGDAYAVRVIAYHFDPTAAESRVSIPVGAVFLTLGTAAAFLDLRAEATDLFGLPGALLYMLTPDARTGDADARIVVVRHATALPPGTFRYLGTLHVAGRHKRHVAHVFADASTPHEFGNVRA